MEYLTYFIWANAVFWIAFPFVVKRFAGKAAAPTHAHEDVAPAVGLPAIIKRIGIFAFGGLAVFAGAIGGAFKETNIVDNFLYNLAPDVDDVLNPCWDDFYLS